MATKNPKTVAGRVLLISVLDDATLIRLDLSGVPVRETIFRLERSDPNYSARYTLALTAAVNRMKVEIQPGVELSQAGEPSIDAITLNFPNTEA